MLLYTDNFLSPFLCGYRKGYNAQRALLPLLDKWYISQDNKAFGGVMLMDLPKAFDTLNHDLLLVKLHAYGSDLLSRTSLLNGRGLKLIILFSTWSDLTKGIPQGSVFGTTIIQFIYKRSFLPNL